MQEAVQGGGKNVDFGIRYVLIQIRVSSPWTGYSTSLSLISYLFNEVLKLLFLAIINSAAMNIGVHISLSILVSSVCMPSSGIAGP